MESIVNLLFEAKMLKEIPRSGYHFLGAGKESVAEHSFMVTFISYVMGKMAPEADVGKLIAMGVLHDLPEARTGDLNYVQKKYVTADEGKALGDAIRDLPFGPDMSDLAKEFNEGKTLEAMLARDADQLAFILDLKALWDIGHRPPGEWLPTVSARLKTDVGKQLLEKIMGTDWDDWWRKNYVDIQE